MRSWYSSEDVDSVCEGALVGGAQRFIKSAGEDEEISAFFHRLSLLDGIPLSYLVCDESFLEEETLHFFFVDPDWVDCLKQGALSIGRYGGRTFGFWRGVQRCLGERDGLSGEGETVSGFLLRSKIVTGWPGMIVRCFQGGQQLKVCRLERLNDSILLCLAEGKIEAVEFEEPREGITMGLTERSPGAFVLELVSLKEGQMGAPIPGEELPAVFRKGGIPGVLDRKAMKAGICQRLQLSDQRREEFCALDLAAEFLARKVRYRILADREEGI